MAAGNSVESDPRPCPRCGYDLRMLDPAGNCPECGLPNHDSQPAAGLLAVCSPAGRGLVFAATALAPAMALAGLVIFLLRDSIFTLGGHAGQLQWALLLIGPGMAAATVGALIVLAMRRRLLSAETRRWAWMDLGLMLLAAGAVPWGVLALLAGIDAALGGAGLGPWLERAAVVMVVAIAVPVVSVSQGLMVESVAVELNGRAHWARRWRPAGWLLLGRCFFTVGLGIVAAVYIHAWQSPTGIHGLVHGAEAAVLLLAAALLFVAGLHSGPTGLMIWMRRIYRRALW